MLDRVGDLELAPRARRDRTRGVVDGGGEHVDPDEREVAARLRRLLGERDDAVAVELRHPVALRVRHGSEQNQRVRLVRAETFDKFGDPTLEEVVAEVHHERIGTEEAFGGEHGVREPGGLVLDDIGDMYAEARPVADGGPDLVPRLGRDDDADVVDPRLREGFDRVEQHWLVSHGDELLRTRVRDRPQARAAAAGENQALHREGSQSLRCARGPGSLRLLRACVPALAPLAQPRHGCHRAQGRRRRPLP